MFKESFKYYKRKCPPPVSDDVITLSGSHDKVLQRRCWRVSSDVEKIVEISGLISPASWDIFELENHPGLIIVRNPFTEEGTRYWVERCLAIYPGPPNKCNLHIHNLLSPEENWWNICQTERNRKENLLKKLRWVTLGYHHDWDTKVYSENARTPMPEELVHLVECIGKVVGDWEVKAEAAILNFYRMDSTLSGHTDHSEPNSTAPLISISFGQSAIFLIGGKSLNDPASAVLVNSGDIMIMSGESRLCYHGVPRIVPADFSLDDSECSAFLKDARINLNIRQVLTPGQKII